jgi:hypothetical protein
MSLFLLVLLLVGGAPWIASSAEAANVLRPSAKSAQGEQGDSNF